MLHEIYIDILTAIVNGNRIECGRCGRLLMEKHIEIDGNTLIATTKCKHGEGFVKCNTLNNVVL